MRTLTLLLFAALPVLAAEKELLKNGGIRGPGGWYRASSGGQFVFKVDRKVGAKKKGSLHLAHDDAQSTDQPNWFHKLDAPKGKPYRLRLSAKVRAEGLEGRAFVMIQLWPKQGNAVGYGSCVPVSKDTDWKETFCIFEVPETCATMIIRAGLVGKGRVWFDDFSLKKTDDPVTAPPAAPRMTDGKYWKLARSCAEEIDWLFDPDAARARARKEKKPILLYVRCVDDKDHLESARKTLRAEEISFYDDGLRKDVLFRAGPLSDPDVSDLVRRRFVPLLVTYHFGVHGNTGGSLGVWSNTGGGPKTVFRIDPAVGAANEGALYMTNQDANPGRADNWLQRIDAPEDKPVRLKLRASIRTANMGKGAQAGVMVQCWNDQALVAGFNLPGVRKDSKRWKKQEVLVAVPENCTNVIVRAVLTGRGEAWFDDLELVRVKGKDKSNLLQDGDVDPRRGTDPLQEFGYKATEVVTPALVALDLEGKPVRKLHRIGTISTDLVDWWLRTVLEETGTRTRGSNAFHLFKEGELDQVLRRTEGKTEAPQRALRARALIRLGRLDEAEKTLERTKSIPISLVRGRLALRRGAWQDALEALDGIAMEEARFWRAWCLQRTHRLAEASKEWEALAGKTRYGRMAAACLLARGPRLWLAASTRAWPRTRKLPEQTEGHDPQGFDAVQSVRLLLELQNDDGSFGSHHEAPGFGYWDGAITALASDALRRWARYLPKEWKKRAETAHEKAVGYLVSWSGRRLAGNDAFNNPYVLMHLVEVGRRDAAPAVIERIRESQQSDGNWTVYHAKRPASFNTAQNVMALALAKKAGVDVPGDVLDRGAEALAAMRQPNDLFPYSTATGHEWMTTEHGSIARDALCEHALLLTGRGDKDKLVAAFDRYQRFAHELRPPTKKYYDYFNRRGHGGYYFFYAHRNAFEAAALADPKVRDRVRGFVRDTVRKVREGDGAFMDHYMIGRAYATAQALIILAPTGEGR